MPPASGLIAVSLMTLTAVICQTTCLTTDSGQYSSDSSKLTSTVSAAAYDQAKLTSSSSSSSLLSLSSPDYAELLRNYTENTTISTGVVANRLAVGTSAIDVTTLWQYLRAVGLLTYAPPLLVVLATVGNVTSVVILQHPMFRKSSTSFILSALAVVDTVIVNNGLMRQWLAYAFNIDLRLTSSFGCKLQFFVSYCAPMISAWTVVLMTAERVVSVWHPLKCKQLCSRRRIVGSWCGIVVVLFVCNCHFFFTFDLHFVLNVIPGINETWSCYYYSCYEYFWSKQWYWIDATVRSFVPFSLIALGNVSIVCRLVIASYRRRNQMGAAGGDARDDITKGAKIPSSTATLIVVSIVFLMLNIPKDTYYLLLGSGVLTEATSDGYAVSLLFFGCITFLFYTNHSINFLMYFASGRKFRLAAKDTITCQWCRAGRRHSGKLPAVGRRMDGNRTVKVTTRM